MDHFAGPDSFDGCEQFILNRAVIPDLILWNMGDHQADTKPGQVLLECHLSIDGHQDVEFMLSGFQ